MHRKEAMIWGALVADAATMGLHWLYDQKRIADLTKDGGLTFRMPNPADFEGTMGFFAHPTRESGDLSQYGEQLMVMLRAIAQDGGYNRATYQQMFRDHFGYGGGYVGYIDRPTRETLDNITAMEKRALAETRQIDPAMDDRTHHMMATKVLACVTRFKGDALLAAVEEAVRETHDDDALVAYAHQIVAVMQTHIDYPGAADDQLPAISKLPGLVAFGGFADVADAVRTTNNDDTAVAYGDYAASLLADVLTTQAMPDFAKSNTPDPVTGVLSRLDETTEAVTADIGMSCSLAYGVPSVVHNLSRATSFSGAIETNISAGGDNCGRAILLGALMGAVHGIGGEKGIPQDWINRLRVRADVSDLLGKMP